MAGNTINHASSGQVDLSSGRRWYKVLFVLTFGLPLLLILILWPFVGFTNFLWMLLATAFVFVTRIRIVSEKDYAGITAFGKPAHEVDSGPHIVPLGADLAMLPKEIQQYEFPDEPEKVSKRRDSEGLLPGESRPMRVMTGPGEEKHGDDPLNTRLALEISSVTAFRLKADGFFEMWIRIPGATWEDKLIEVRKRLRDTNDIELTEEFARRASPEILKEIKSINTRLHGELQNAVNEYGVEIVEAKLKSPDFPVELNEQLAGIAVSMAKAKRVAIDAAAEKERLITVSEGDMQAGINLAAVLEAELAAQGKGLAEAAKAAGMSIEDYVASWVAQKAITNGDMILGAEGIAQAIGLGRLIYGKNTGGAS